MENHESRYERCPTERHIRLQELPRSQNNGRREEDLHQTFGQQETRDSHHGWQEQPNECPRRSMLYERR